MAAALLAVPAPSQAKSFQIARTGAFALQTGLLMSALAKELCSCINVQRLGDGLKLGERIEICLERGQLPITPGLIRAMTGIAVDPSRQYFEVDARFLGALARLFTGRGALANYDPRFHQYGCTLIDERIRHLK